MAQVLALTNHDLVGGALHQIFKTERRKGVQIFACAEDFSYGPLVARSTPEALLRLRYRVWLRSGIINNVKRRQAKTSLREMIARADEIEIYLGGSGREQLFLLALVSLLHPAANAACAIRVYQYPSQYYSQSLSMTSREILVRRPPPVSLGRDGIARLLDLWSRVTSPTPELLFDARHNRDLYPDLPYLTRAYADLVSSYPEATTGLTLMDRRLLEALSQDWRHALRVASDAHIGTGREREFGDRIVADRLRQLADPGLPCPAVELRGDARDPRLCDTRITEFGAACLRGAANYVSHNGIDAWVGGVHLNSAKGAMWFRDADDRLVIA